VRTLISVARYHLVDRTTLVVLPWAALTFAFFVDLVIFAFIPVSHHLALTPGGVRPVAVSAGRDGAGLASVLAVFFAAGILSIGRSLPFALALGLSRRAYYAGTAALATALAVTYGLAITGLQAIERATGGWGVTMHVFQVPYILTGPWYLTWLTASVALGLLFAYGMWTGLVYRRWGLPGLIAFLAGQITVALLAVLATTWAHGWTGVGRFLASLTAAGATGLLAVLAAILLAGGYATIRRATV
jgi:hypothetical protein